MEHQGIKIEFIGQIELFYDRGNHHEFTSLVKELARPGEMITNTSYPFEFSCVEKPFEVYTGQYFFLVTKKTPETIQNNSLPLGLNEHTRSIA